MLDNRSWTLVSGGDTNASRHASGREFPEGGHEKTRTVRSGFSLWQMRDSNPRRHSQLIYSQPPLAARVICRGITHGNK